MKPVYDKMDVYYTASFSNGDSNDDVDFGFAVLNDKEAAAYTLACMTCTPVDEVPELEDFLEKLEAEIIEQERDNFAIPEDDEEVNEDIDIEIDTECSLVEPVEDDVRAYISALFEEDDFNTIEEIVDGQLYEYAYPSSI